MTSDLADSKEDLRTIVKRLGSAAAYSAELDSAMIELTQAAVDDYIGGGSEWSGNDDTPLPQKSEEKS